MPLSDSVKQAVIKNDLETLKLLLESATSKDLENLVEDPAWLADFDHKIEDAMFKKDLETIRFYINQPKLSPFSGSPYSLLERARKGFTRNSANHEIISLWEKIQAERTQSPIASLDSLLLEYQHLISNIKFAGHVLGINAKIPVRYITGVISPISTERGFPYPSSKMLSTLLRSYLTLPIYSASMLRYFTKIQSALNLYENYLANNGKVDHNAFVKEYHKGQGLIIISVHFKTHRFCVALNDNKLILCNRGVGRLETGISLFDIKDTSKIDTEFIKEITKRFESVQELFNFLRKYIHTSKCISLPSSEQGHGTCAFVNTKSSFLGILYILALEDNFTPKEALDFACTEYKKFTTYMRDECLQLLLNDYQRYKKASDEDSSLVMIKIFANYALEHHGEANPKKRGKSRPEKKQQDIERVKKILDNLSEEDKKIFFEEIKKSGDLRMLAVIARFYPEPRFVGSILTASNFWHLYTDALLSNHKLILDYFLKFKSLTKFYRNIPDDQLQIIKRIVEINLGEGPDKNLEILEKVANFLSTEQQLQLCELLKQGNIEVRDEDLQGDKPLLNIIKAYATDSQYNLTPHPVVFTRVKSGDESGKDKLDLERKSSHERGKSPGTS